MKNKFDDNSYFGNLFSEILTNAFSNLDFSLKGIKIERLQNQITQLALPTEQITKNLQNAVQASIFQSISKIDWGLNLNSITDSLNKIYKSENFRLMKSVGLIFPELKFFPLSDIEDFIDFLPADLKEEISSFTPEQTSSDELTRAFQNYFQMPANFDSSDEEEMEDKVLKASVQQTTEKITEDVMRNINLIHPELFSPSNNSKTGKHIKSLVIFIISAILTGILSALGEDLYHTLKSNLFNAIETENQEALPLQDPGFQNEPKHFSDNLENICQLEDDSNPASESDFLS